MRCDKSLVILFGLAISQGCSHSGRDSDTSSAAATPPLVFDSVLLHRSNCLGTCPVYDVEVYGDGRVLYSGESFVAVTGSREGKIPPSSVDFIRRSLEQIDFLNLRDSYAHERDGCKVVAQEYPTAEITFRRFPIVKHIVYYYGCMGSPNADHVAWIARTIDDVAGSSVWVGWPQY